MADSSSVAFREGDKVKGFPNYYVWALKMRAILRAKGQWIVTETEHTLAAFLVVIEGETLTETQLKKQKTLACRIL